MNQHFHTPEQFVGYIEQRAENSHALYSIEEIHMMLSLTGKSSTDVVHFDMKHLCLLARFNFAQKAKSQGRKFDDTKFRHLSLVSD